MSFRNVRARHKRRQKLNASIARPMDLPLPSRQPDATNAEVRAAGGRSTLFQARHGNDWRCRRLRFSRATASTHVNLCVQIEELRMHDSLAVSANT